MHFSFWEGSYITVMWTGGGQLFIGEVARRCLRANMPTLDLETEIAVTHGELADRARRGEFERDNLSEMVDAMPNGRGLVLAAAVECLGATRSYYDAPSRGTVHEPEYRVRLDAAKFLASYVWGIPPKTAIVANVNVPGASKLADGQDPMATLEQSPALQEYVRAMLARAGTPNGTPKALKQARAAK